MYLSHAPFLLITRLPSFIPLTLVGSQSSPARDHLLARDPRPLRRPRISLLHRHLRLGVRHPVPFFRLPDGLALAARREPGDHPHVPQGWHAPRRLHPGPRGLSHPRLGGGQSGEDGGADDVCGGEHRGGGGEGGGDGWQDAPVSPVWRRACEKLSFSGATMCCFYSHLFFFLFLFSPLSAFLISSVVSRIIMLSRS